MLYDAGQKSHLPDCDMLEEMFTMVTGLYTRF